MRLSLRLLRDMSSIRRPGVATTMSMPPRIASSKGEGGRAGRGRWGGSTAEADPTASCLTLLPSNSCNPPSTRCTQSHATTATRSDSLQTSGATSHHLPLAGSTDCQNCTTAPQCTPSVPFHCALNTMHLALPQSGASTSQSNLLQQMHPSFNHMHMPLLTWSMIAPPPASMTALRCVPWIRDWRSSNTYRVINKGMSNWVGALDQGLQVLQHLQSGTGK